MASRHALGTFYSVTGEPTSDILRARDHFRKAEVILSKTPEGQAVARYGLHLHMRGRLAESRAVLEQAWQTAFRLNVTAVAFVATWTGGGRIGFDHDSPEVRRSDSAIRGQSMLDSLCREPSRCPFAPSPVKKKKRGIQEMSRLYRRAIAD